MELIIIYILSVVFSAAGDFILSLKLIKDVANAGYLIDSEKLKEISDKINISSGNSLIKYIPIVNIINTLDNVVKYNNAKSDILNQLNIYGALSEMTDEEKKEYNKKPSFLRALKIDIDRDLRLKEPQVSTLNVYNNTGKIWYEKENNDFIILKATGTAQDISRYTQINLIDEHHKELVNEGIKYFGDPLKFLLAVRDCKNFNEWEDVIKKQKAIQEALYEMAKMQLEEIRLKNSINNQQEEIKEEDKKLVKKL